MLTKNPAHLCTVNFLTSPRRPNTGLELAESYARRAVALDPASPKAHWALGQTHFVRGEIDLFESEFSKAIALNPNDITINASYGLYLAGLRGTDRALDSFRKAMDLSGHAPPWAYMIPWLSHFQSGDYAAALTDAESIATPGLLWGALAHAACFGMTGRKNEARAAVDEILRMQPHFCEEGSVLLGRLIRSAALREQILEGLKRAGLPVSVSPQSARR